ncbi:MAG: hypothetical protein AB8B56_16340 [Crocinitomicaceae bacterium]
MRRARAFIAFSVVVGGLLFSSCKKHTIDQPNSTDPVFKVEGTIDGSALNLVAGDDNAYMFTSIEQENGIQIFTGNLSDGNISIEMGIYDGLVDIPGQEAIKGLSGSHAFSRMLTTPLAILTKDDFPNVDLIDHISWIVNGTAETGDSIVIMEPGIYSVCADVVFTDQSSAQLCSELILGYERHANSYIKHFLSPEGTLTALLEDPLVAVEKVEWFLDDVLISKQAEFFYKDLGSGSHVLRAQVNFENGVKRTKSMIVDGDLQGKFIHDLTLFETMFSTLLNRDFNVRLKLEENGTTYSSSSANNSINTVSIDDVTYYGKDASGNSVYKIKAHVVATVQDIQNVNNTRELDFETTFGLAFPAE